MGSLLLLSLVVGLLLGFLTRGDPRHITRVHFHAEALLALLFVFVMVWPSLASGLGVGPAEFVLSWSLGVALLAGLALMNSRWVGMLTASAGLLANLVVVAANGGMPVMVEEVGSVAENAGQMEAISRSLLHVPYGEGTLLPLLVDRVPIPSIGGSQLLSLGDILLAVGACVLVVEMMHGAGLLERSEPKCYP